tara:strand:+ start:176 stop:451 length:276 start_codon:yes stop_codon:yes gene_type:complete
MTAYLFGSIKFWSGHSVWPASGAKSTDEDKLERALKLRRYLDSLVFYNDNAKSPLKTLEALRKPKKARPDSPEGMDKNRLYYAARKYTLND